MAEALFAHLDGILVPGGFGPRGRRGQDRGHSLRPGENRIPYLGMCLGMQLATIEFARHLAGLDDRPESRSSTISPCEPVIYLMREWFDYRLNKVINRDESPSWAAPCAWAPTPACSSPVPWRPRRTGSRKSWSATATATNSTTPTVSAWPRQGMAFTGTSPDGELVEIVEMPDHPWFLGCQFHPEFKSRPQTPHPLFRDYVGACYAYKQGQGK